MRLSVRKEDAGYDPDTCMHAKVFVDGEEVSSRCFTADEEEGKAWCYKLNDEGEKFVRDGIKIAEEVLTGEVKIVMP